MTITVKEVITKDNPIVKLSNTVFDALSTMTSTGLGAVSVVNEGNELQGIFTDGDLRRGLESQGKNLLDKSLSDVLGGGNSPITIPSNALLLDAVNLFKEKSIDNIIVTENNAPIGMLDIQDFVKMNLVG